MCCELVMSVGFSETGQRVLTLQPQGTPQPAGQNTSGTEVLKSRFAAMAEGGSGDADEKLEDEEEVEEDE